MARITTQDTIQLTLNAEQTVVNATIKVIAQIAALVQPTQTDAELRAEIRATMQKLIPDAEWQFSNLARGTDASGVERVTLTATTRVSEEQNSNLDNRARDASRPGLTITNVRVDSSIPQHMLDKARQDLRLDLLAKARDEVAKINEVMGEDPLSFQTYRVATVDFDSVAADHSNVRIKGAVMAAAAATSYGSGFSDEGVLGNAQKLTMTANITLARFAESVY